MRFPWQEYWTRLPFPFPVHLPDPGIEPMSPALEGEFFITEPPGKANFLDTRIINQVHEEKHMESQVLH